MRGPSIVAIGGGHGLAATLAAARTYAGEVTAVVSVADDGGSSGRIRQSVGIPAPGDLRRCLVALADPNSVWAKVFDYRFGAGDLEGHALGNLIIAGLSEATGDFTAALAEAGRLLGAAGRVLPVTTSPTTLRASVNGAEIIGEVQVNTSAGPIASVSVLGPDGAETPAHHSVIEAVRGADQVIIGPGSLFTSVLAACVVPGVREALGARRGGRIYVANLAPEHRETEGMSLAQHAAALADHGVTVDVVVCDPAAFEAASDVRAAAEPAASMRVGDTDIPVRLETAALAGPGGREHHTGRLAAVLRALVEG
ncbi:MAG: uridine diphosphate-N-acetylglucosamine-binding protein YvcK [Actinomycetota bacterium]|nr:uridine diphosphate-N-acetylglucosamine-binding protein YvcK [Actinomycetota bacterium]